MRWDDCEMDLPSWKVERKQGRQFQLEQVYWFSRCNTFKCLYLALDVAGVNPFSQILASFSHPNQLLADHD